MTSIPSFALLVGLVGACGTQTDADYRGEPLLRLSGRVVNERPVEPAAQVTMVWNYDSGAGDFAVGETIEVVGAFPASFTLDLFEPPAGMPAGAFATIGFISALARGTTAVPDEDALLGIAEQHVVVYLSTDVADLPAAQHDDAVAALGGELLAGHHLMAVMAGSGSFDRLVPVPSTSVVTVRMAPADQLQIPDVF